MTDPFEQARETLQRTDREPDWTALRQDTLTRVARERADAGSVRTGRPRRWTALVTAAAVAAVVVGVVGAVQLTERLGSPEPSPAANTPLDRVSGAEALARVRDTVVSGAEPLAAVITFVHGRDERATLIVGPDQVVVTTERYRYVEQRPADGGDRYATFVDHERRAYLATGDERVLTKVVAQLPLDLAAVAVQEPLGPLLDPDGWQVESSQSTREHGEGRLSLTLTPAPTLKPTGPIAPLSSRQAVGRVVYVVDVDSLLPESVRVRSRDGAGFAFDGTISWVPARDVLLEDPAPEGYRDLAER